MNLTNKGDPDSGNPNPLDVACAKPGPCQGMKRAKSKAISKRREETTSPTQLCNPKHGAPTSQVKKKLQPIEHFARLGASRSVEKVRGCSGPFPKCDSHRQPSAAAKNHRVQTGSDQRSSQVSTLHC